MNARRLILDKRPMPGLVTQDVLRVENIQIPLPGPGAFRVKIEFLSLDPAMRGWMNEGKSYVAPVALGSVMRAYAVGHVEASNHPDFKVGDAVQGLFGAQTHAISTGDRVVKVDATAAPLERWVGGLGMPGWTAYFGLLDVGVPKAGDTVVVSAASGAVGSIVGQIAKIKGCRVVGIAGGPEKCRYVVEHLGFDACVDYRSATFATDLKTACPNGIDVDFENVGGDVLDAILPQMNPFGRIAVCGLISAYVATTQPDGLKNVRYILTQRLRMQGLIVFDWETRIPEAIAALGQWHREGKLKIREDVRSGGLAAFVDTLNLLYTSGNNGKLVLKV
jgi:NADPH-dependent curcumin reductase